MVDAFRVEWMVVKVSVEAGFAGVWKLLQGGCKCRKVPQLTDDCPARPGLQNAGRGGLLELTFYLPGHVLWALNSSLY
jgi:hypothetical protein